MKIIIYGASNYAQLVHHYIQTTTYDEVVAYCVDKEYLTFNRLKGLPVIAFEEIESSFEKESHAMITAIGYSTMRARKTLFEKAKNKGYALTNYISPNANVDESATIGYNNIIMAGVHIEPFTTIGSNNVFWTSSVICHDAHVGDNCFFAAKSLIGGFSKINDGCFLGFNSTVLHNVTLEEETLVGANSLVLKNTTPFTKYIGSPAKATTKHQSVGIKVS